MAELRVGISGWTYGPWRGSFYPEDVTQKRELEFASRQMNSIEINGSFYSLQTPASYQKWYEQTPADFVFAVKAGRYITHMKRLKDVEKPLADFLASGVLKLEEKLGPMLWQFPPNMQFDAGKFEAFFEMLPRDTETAAKIARGHDAWMKGRVYTKTQEKRRMRHAVEVRHPSFADAKFVELLRRHGIAWVFADTAGKWPYAEDVTADFVYARLHGDKELYVSGYTDEALDWWAARLKAWMKGKEPGDAKRVDGKARAAKQRDAYVYFDNDVKVRAPFDAMNLYARLTGSKERVKMPAGTKTMGEARTSWAAMYRERNATGGAAKMRRGRVGKRTSLPRKRGR